MQHHPTFILVFANMASYPPTQGYTGHSQSKNGKIHKPKPFTVKKVKPTTVDQVVRDVQIKAKQQDKKNKQMLTKVSVTKDDEGRNVVTARLPDRPTKTSKRVTFELKKKDLSTPRFVELVNGNPFAVKLFRRLAKDHVEEQLALKRRGTRDGVRQTRQGEEEKD
jgi:signal recognition particle subunit SEC65